MWRVGWVAGDDSDEVRIREEVTPCVTVGSELGDDFFEYPVNSRV